MINGEWIKLHHFSPSELNMKTDSIPTVVRNIEEIHMNDKLSKINNDTNLTSDNLFNIVKSKINDDEEQSLLFDSNMKDTVLGTHWFLSQQDDNTIRGKLVFLQKVKQHLLHGICK